MEKCPGTSEVVGMAEAKVTFQTFLHFTPVWLLDARSTTTDFVVEKWVWRHLRGSDFRGCGGRLEEMEGGGREVK